MLGLDHNIETFSSEQQGTGIVLSHALNYQPNMTPRKARTLSSSSQNVKNAPIFAAA